MGQLIREKEIFAVAGGKGGVGKSFLATNLGIILARSNRDKSAILIDADLGGANLHTCLGMPTPETTLSDFLRHPSMRIDDVVLRTSVENLSLISGAQDFLGIANPKYTQKIRILRGIQSLRADFIILDLGAGTSFNTIDFFLLADKGILVVVPEPTSIENAYRFIKSAFYRRLKFLTVDPRIKTVIDKAMERKNDLGIRVPAELIDYVARLDAEVGRQLKEAARNFRPRIVLNQVRSAADIRIGYSMQNACMKFFGIKPDFVGYLENDEQVWQSIRKRKPIALNGDGGKCLRNLVSISNNILNDAELKLD